MSISFDNFLGMHEHAMKLRTERASVISSNLANADTPNYKAKDIDFQQALRQKMGNTIGMMSAQTSHKGHMGGTDSVTGGAERFFRIPHQPSIDGNTVEENIEHAEFMKNSLEFQASFTMLNSKFKGLRSAIKGE